MELSQTDRQISERLFILTLISVAYFYAGGGWNQNAQFDLTRAIVERGTFAIDAFTGNTGDISRYGVHIYANKAPGLSFLAAIPYALLFAIEHARYPVSEPLLLTTNAYVCTVATCGVLVALVPFFLFREARRSGFGAFWSAIVALTTVLATQLWPYATMFVAQSPSGALMFIAFMLARRDSALSQFGSGVCAGVAGITNYLCIPAAIVIALFAVYRSKKHARTLLCVVAGGAPFALLLALYQSRCCGGFFTTPIATMDPRFVSKGAALGIFEGPSLDALYGITISPYRGLFYFAPVLLMALVGMVVWMRRPGTRHELLAIAVISAMFFAFNISFNGWEGGFGIGARYLVPLIPLWSLAMLRCRGWQKPLLGALAIVSFAINFASTAVDPQPSGTIPQPLTQYIVPLLVTGHFSPHVPITPPWSAATFTGHTSVNRMTHDEAIVFRRHPPESAAAEWSSFNLGEAFFGPGDVRSLAPIALVVAAGVAWILATARRAEAASQSR